MKSKIVQGLCLLVHLFYRVVAEQPPPAVLITILDSSPVTFRSQVAKFGDQFQYSKNLQPLLMLPPDEPNLCVFPSSLENMTRLEARNLTLDRPFALLVARGNCSFDEKALMVAAMQDRFAPYLKYMIVYNTNSSQPNDLIYMSSNSTVQGLEGVGATFLSWNAGVMLLDKVSNYSNHTGLSSKFLSDSTRDWDLRVNLEVVFPKDDQGSGTDSEPDDAKNAFYSLRFVLFTLLIVSPCIRAGYLWYSAGGRILIRRDENGRVVGLQYVRPMPYWFATGSDVLRDDHETTVLTEDQVLQLPELVYKRKAVDDDDGQSEYGDEGESGAVNTKESKDSKIESIDGNNPLDAKITENSGDVLENSEAVNESSEAELFTTCTMCSICIDEFEDGERIRILPKCHHGFHFDCIKPWLTERQSRCPLCKTDVLTPVAPSLTSSDSQDSPA
ncbi:RING-like zinc finger [Fragilaria crotonensis]|nr:RING-like zinc finger [Fragilaria crotonensis]